MRDLFGSKAGRWAALDNLRGLTVFLMLPVNAGMEFANLPAWMKHAPGPGITMADFIMPVFLYALGVSSSFSLPRRLQEKGLVRTLLHALRRYGLLFVFGTIGFVAVWGSRNWEILQMLGMAGALAFPFLFLPPAGRAAAAAALLALVQALRPAFFDATFRAWYGSGIGGPAGAIPLAAIPLAASALGEILRGRPWGRRTAAAAAAGAACLAAGTGLSFLVPVDKHMLSVSYLVLTFGAACLALSALTLFDPLVGGRLPPLGALGRNPLLAYMLGGVLTLGLRAWVPVGIPAWGAWACSLGVLALVTAVCIVLDWKRISIRL
jgi:predicted acyltransferase